MQAWDVARADREVVLAGRVAAVPARRRGSARLRREVILAIFGRRRSRRGLLLLLQHLQRQRTRSVLELLLLAHVVARVVVQNAQMPAPQHAT